MNGSKSPQLDLREVRTIGGIITTAGRLYIRYPAVFLTLAAMIMVPYSVLVVALAGLSAATGRGTTAEGSGLLIVAITVIVVAPVISALELQALVALGSGERPHVGTVFRRALPVMLGVAAAQIIASLLIVLGVFCLLIPGIIIGVRLAVVSQTAAYEQTKWPTTLRRSWEMSRGNFWHILGLVLANAVLQYLFSMIIGGIFSFAGNDARSVISLILGVITESFGALVLGLLYFELRARESPLA